MMVTRAPMICAAVPRMAVRLFAARRRQRRDEHHGPRLGVRHPVRKDLLPLDPFPFPPGWVT